MNPKYPIYIPSKGRYDSRLTAKALDKIGVPYRVVIESQEYDQYATVIDPAKILVLPFSDRGLIAARCWIMQHSISEGYARHWQIDDNIKTFRRNQSNRRIEVSDGSIFRASEDFCDRYENIAYAGFQYTMFATTQLTHHNPVFLLNTRIYSCTMVNNSIPYRWRSIYNDDTDVSLMALKDGWCTCLFYAFLCDKARTMTIKGGNTESLYKLDNADGRLLMAQALQKLHPDVVTITRKWGRWQHQVDYRPFKKNRLIKKEGVVIPQGVNNYGMVLKRKDEVTA
jgi:hypothetical protein